MGLYNRFVEINQPLDWTSTHNPTVAPDKNIDWYHWHIATHPFTDMIQLFVEGDLGAGQTAVDRMQELFDLTQTEVDQLMEVWTNFINVPSGNISAQRVNTMRFLNILRAMERGIPQQYVADPKVWLYNKLGITIADDR